jgi:hypothetical protein
MNLAEKCIWAAFIHTLAKRYGLSDKVKDKLVELYLDESEA